MPIGHLIKKYRKEKKWTQVDLARLVNKSSHAISNLERGHTQSLTSEDIKKIANALSLPADDLFSMESDGGEEKVNIIVDGYRKLSDNGKLRVEKLIELELSIEKKEKEKRKKRQAEGIAAAQKSGKNFGRPRTPLVDDWDTIVALYKNGDISLEEALRRSKLKKATFYLRLKEREKGMESKNSVVDDTIGTVTKNKV